MKRLSALPPKLAVFPLPATEQTQPAVQFAGKTRQFVSQKHKAFKQLLLLLVAVAAVAGVVVVVVALTPAVKCCQQLVKLCHK